MLKSEYIFISYKREDFEKANRIKNVLKSLNLKVWWDEELQTGQKWEEEIDLKLVNASSVLVLWSERAEKSDWVRHEASYAKINNKLVQAKISNCTVPAPFQSKMAADLVDWKEHDNEPSFVRLTSEVRRIIRVERIKRWFRLLFPILPAIFFFTFYFVVLHKDTFPYPIDGGLVADFNGPEGAGALTSYGLPFSLMSDSSQNMESKVWYARVYDRVDQNHFAKIYYQLNPSSGHEGYAGIYFDFTLPPAKPVNLDEYGGVRFRMRINQQDDSYPNIRIVLYSKNIQNPQYAYPMAPVRPTSEWNTYSIPFADFTSPPHAHNHESVILDKRRVFRFALVIVGNDKVHGNIDVDDIAFFKS